MEKNLQEFEINVNKAIKEAGITVDIKVTGKIESRVRFFIAQLLVSIAGFALNVKMNLSEGEQK
jgi:lipoate-protein ligase B